MKVVLNIEINRVLEPKDIQEIVRRAEFALPASAPSLVIALSGRLPVWAFGALIHHYHPALAVAVYDPRLGGGVVVATHSPEFKVGQVVDLADFAQVKVQIL